MPEMRPQVEHGADPGRGLQASSTADRRFQVEIVAFAVLLVFVFVPLVLFVDSKYLFLGIIVALAWMFLYMPFWRRRLRRAVANAPRWELHPE